MPVSAPNFQTLEAALDRLGKAWVLVGDPLTASGLAVLGLTEGQIGRTITPQYATRTYPEHTGDVPHEKKLLGYSVSLDIPLIDGDPAVYAKVSPTGAKSGGHLEPQDVTTTTLVLVPELEFANGFEYSTGAWVQPATAPEHTIWIPKGHFNGRWPQFVPTSDGVSKGTEPVTFEGIIDTSGDWPDGARSWVVGDPAALGVALAI